MPCKSPWNILLLLFQKPRAHDYHLVQDPREKNRSVDPIHLSLTSIPFLKLLASRTAGIDCRVMKDAFFSLPLAEKPTNFASEWTDLRQNFWANSPRFSCHRDSKASLVWSIKPSIAIFSSTEQIQRGDSYNMWMFSWPRLQRRNISRQLEKCCSAWELSERLRYTLRKLLT